MESKREKDMIKFSFEKITENIVQTMIWREAVDFGETSSKESIVAVKVRDGSSLDEDRMEEKRMGRRGTEGKSDRSC